MNLTQCRPEPSILWSLIRSLSLRLSTHITLITWSWKFCMDGQEQLIGECAYSLTTYLTTVDATYMSLTLDRLMFMKSLVLNLMMSVVSSYW